MADISKLTSKAAGAIAAGAAVAGTVESITGALKKSIPQVPNSLSGVKSLAKSAVPTSKKINATPGQFPVADVVRNSRIELQNFNFLAYPSDPAPYEIRFNFLKFKQTSSGDLYSGRELISKSLRDVQDSVEIVKIAESVVVLPLPTNLVEALNIQYDQLDQGVFTGPIAQGISTVLNDVTEGARAGGFQGAIDTALTSAGAQLSGLYKAVTTDTETILAVLARSAIAKVNTPVSGVVDQSRANIINPHRTLQFNGVELRTYEYSWKLSPNSPAESETVRKIVREFQRRALPDKTDRYFLKYPDLVLVKFVRLEKQLYEHKLCFIESVSVNYAPSGQPSFFAGTDAPVEIDLSIRLRETSIRTREDMKEVTSHTQ